MRELLEKAHQQDEDDLFKEEEGDEEFTAPGDYDGSTINCADVQSTSAMCS